MTAEVLSEIQRLRPAWLRRPAEARAAEAALRRAKAAWRRLRDNSSYIPSGIPTNEAFVRQLQKEGREGQKARKAILRQGLEPDVESALGTARPLLESDVNAMSPSDRHWRVIGGALWWDALAGATGLADMRTWLSGSLRPINEIPRDDWMRVWCLEIDIWRVPAFALYMLAELHQTDLGVELNTSNSFDAIHASYLLDVDSIISRDRNFLKVVEAIRPDVPFGFAKTVQFDDALLPHSAAFRVALMRSRQ
jgi:hypothetical protein